MNYDVVSDRTLRRLPKYLYYLKNLKDEGEERTSAAHLARITGIHHTQVRKDLATTGVRGVPKVGHVIDELIDAIESFLNWQNTESAILVGAGNMGTALIGYNGFQNSGIRIVAAFDSSVDVIDREINGVKVYPVDEANAYIREHKIRIGIIATPASVSQQVASIMASNGILAIWNFTPKKLNLSNKIIVENVDIYSSLAVLSRKLINEYGKLGE